MPLFPGFEQLPSYVQNTYKYNSDKYRPLPTNTDGGISGPVLTLTNKGGTGYTLPLVQTSDGWWTNNHFLNAGADPTENITNMDKPIYSLNNSLTTADNNIFNHSILPDGYDMRVSFGNPAQSNLYPQRNPVQDEISRNEYYRGLDTGDALSLAWKKDPWGVSMGLANGAFNTIGSIWNGIQQYRTAKQAMDLANKDYELKKQAYEANEARNQEKFNWLRQSRATSQL